MPATFMQSLAANPSGGSGIYNTAPQPDQGNELKIVNQLKDRDMMDFKNKAEFMSDLSLKQDRLRALYDPAKSSPQPQQQTSAMPDPEHPFGNQDQISGSQKADLAMKQQGMDLDKAKLAQQGKLGEEALDVKSKSEALAQQKSDQIKNQKINELQQKTDAANQKIELAQQKLQQSGDNAAAQLQSHKDLAAAMEERHKLELAQKDHQFQVTSDQHAQQIKDLEQKVKDSRNKKVTTEINADGTKKTTTTASGSAAQTIQVKGKDGQTYEIPADKKDEWDQQHAPEDQSDASSVIGGSNNATA